MQTVSEGDMRYHRLFSEEKKKNQNVVAESLTQYTEYQSFNLLSKCEIKCYMVSGLTEESYKLSEYLRPKTSMTFSLKYYTFKGSEFFSF